MLLMVVWDELFMFDGCWCVFAVADGGRQQMVVVGVVGVVLVGGLWRH